jgi:hypothetical protein
MFTRALGAHLIYSFCRYHLAPVCFLPLHFASEPMMFTSQLHKRAKFTDSRIHKASRRSPTRQVRACLGHLDRYRIP